MEKPMDIKADILGLHFTSQREAGGQAEKTMPFLWWATLEPSQHVAQAQAWVQLVAQGVSISLGWGS